VTPSRPLPLRRNAGVTVQQLGSDAGVTAQPSASRPLQPVRSRQATVSLMKRLIAWDWREALVDDQQVELGQVRRPSMPPAAPPTAPRTGVPEYMIGVRLCLRRSDDVSCIADSAPVALSSGVTMSAGVSRVTVGLGGADGESLARPMSRYRQRLQTAASVAPVAVNALIEVRRLNRFGPDFRAIPSSLCDRRLLS
jgi:hypothetical protein